MTIPCNYYINVAKSLGYRYVHYCRIELGDYMLDKTAKEKFAEICKRFPKEDGYKCTLYYAECVSYEIKEEEK